MKRAASAGAMAVQHDLPFMALDQGADNEQAQAGPLDVAVFTMQAVKQAEDLMLFTGGNAAALIAYQQMAALMGGVEFHVDLDRRIGIKHGILQQVAQDHGEGVGFDIGVEIRGNVAAELQRIILGVAPLAHVVVKKFRQVAWPQGQPPATLLQAVGGDHFIDQAVETLGIGQHGVDETIELFLGRVVTADGFQMQLHRGHRRFEFMRYLGNEALLLAVKGQLATPVQEDDIDPGENGRTAAATPR